MPRLIMYTGGARSGKSRLAQERLSQFKHVAYIATAQALDDEMKSRIEKHKLERPTGWLTIEEPLDLRAAINRAHASSPDAVLVDCLTLWLSNRMLEVWSDGWKSTHEDNIANAFKEALSEIRKSGSQECVIVTNEVGCGIVPENAMSRAFRDLTGRINQLLAAESDEVFLTTSGLVLKLK
jgi:adenosylcobinamide kinase / adenosylcobinamide-phosphate guanylyltransferase